MSLTWRKKHQIKATDTELTINGNSSPAIQIPQCVTSNHGLVRFITIVYDFQVVFVSSRGSGEDDISIDDLEIYRCTCNGKQYINRFLSLLQHILMQTLCYLWPYTYISLCMQLNNFTKNNFPGCDGTPCMNGGTCIHTGTGKGYLCLCTAGYTGVICETGNFYQFATKSINQSYWYQYLALFDCQKSAKSAIIWRMAKRRAIPKKM